MIRRSRRYETWVLDDCTPLHKRDYQAQRANAAVTASIVVSPTDSTVEIPVTDNAEKEGKNQNNVDFDDFGSSNAATEPVSYCLSCRDTNIKNIKKEEENQNDDNFGDFGTSDEAAEPFSVDVSPVDSAVETCGK
eukprot:15349085-Ditylum_brightwellii.AAC.1